MAAVFNLKDAIVEALTSLGGTGTAPEVREYLRAKFGREWKNIETVMDDLSVESASSFFAPEERVLRRVGQGRYALRDLAVSEGPEAEKPTIGASSERNELGELVMDGIRKAVNKFREQPCVFFSETDLHAYLYHCLYSTRFEVETADGAATSCLHKEYPTNFRYSKETMEDYGFSKKGIRGHCDFAILNPQFVRVSSLASVVNKDVNDAEDRRARNEDAFRKELLAAIELKYVVSNSRAFIDEVEKDIKKLAIGLKYQSFEAYNLVFCNQEYHYIDDLVKVVEHAEPGVKSMLVSSHYTADHKKETPKPVTNGWSL